MHNIRLSLAGLYLLCFGGVGLAAAEDLSSRPTLQILEITNAPVLDGKLDDACWQGQAGKAENFRLAGSDKAPVGATEAWVASDGQWLYLAFLCKDSNADDLVRRVTHRDGAVGTDDSVEVFIDPGTEGKHYFHFSLSAANVQADQLCRPDGERDRNWNAPWRSAVYIAPNIVQNQGWSAELALPLYALRRNAGTGEWRINLCRNKMTQPREYSAWAPVKGGYHEPESFGVLQGMQELKPAPVFAPMLNTAAVEPYTFTEGRYRYLVRGELYNDGGLSGTVEVVVQDRPLEGAPSQVATNLILRPAEKCELAIAVPIARPGPRQCTISLRQTGSAEDLQTFPVANMDALNPLAAFLDRNYYTTEEKAVVTASAVMGAGAVAKEFSIVAGLKDEAGTPLPSCKAVLQEGQTSLAVPLNSVKPGSYVFRLELTDARGMVVGVQELNLVKAPPVPAGGSEVKIDQVNRCVLVDGKPFLPIGMIGGSTNDMPRYHDAGFNTFVLWSAASSNPASAAIGLLDTAARHGLKVIINPFCYLKENRRKELRGYTAAWAPAFDKSIEDVRELARAICHHPALLAYYGVDEAPLGPAITPRLQKLYQALHEGDPYHPVYFSGGAAANASRYDMADILGSHGGWCPLAGHTVNGWVLAVGNADRKSQDYHRPLFVMPCGEWKSLSRRAISPAERRIEVYLLLMHGARSLLYFAAPIRHHATLDNMTRISREVRAMESALLTREPSQEVAVTPAVEISGLPVVQAQLRDRPEGGTLLLAGNSSRLAVRVAYDLSRLGGKPVVKDFFSDKTYAVADGVFTDDLGGYAPRAYLVTGVARQAGAPAALSLKLSGPAVDALLGRSVTNEMPVGQNILRMPRIDASRAGWTFTWDPPIEADGDRVSFPPEGRAGQSCLKITLTNTASRLRLFADSVTLKPGYSYEYGAWIKTVWDETPKPLSLSLHSLSNQAVNSGKPVNPTNGKWERFARQVGVPATNAPMPGSFGCMIPSGCRGTVWIDELFVNEIPPASPAAKSRNWLSNSSFEQATLPAWPDCWLFSWDPPGVFFGDEGTSCQDGTTAWNGKYSLRLDYRGDKSGRDIARVWYKHIHTPSRGGIVVERGQDYVLSAYLKAATTGAQAVLTICNYCYNSPMGNECLSTNIAVTTEWQRYQLPFTMPTNNVWTRGVWPEVTIFIANQGRKKAAPIPIWVDAVQFEPGTNATPYQADDYRWTDYTVAKPEP